jgi:carboxymethylenebutenolidase
MASSERDAERYLALPERGSGPGVLVLHSWWGLNDFFRGLCDRFASAGFVALAPDLYGGKVTTTIASARKLRAAVTASRREPAYKFLIRMIQDLVSHDALTTPHIGVVGFSMGGHWAWWLAQRPELPIAATVVFYAARSGDFSKSQSRFLGHFAETDEWVSVAGVRKVKRALEAAGKSVVFHTYPGTTHLFFEGDRVDAFVPEAAAVAWSRTLAFLQGLET